MTSCNFELLFPKFVSVHVKFSRALIPIVVYKKKSGFTVSNKEKNFACSCQWCLGFEFDDDNSILIIIKVKLKQ